MLEYLLNTSANDFCQYCPRRGASAKLPGRRPQAQWTGSGPVNEGVMFGELNDLLFLFVEEYAWVFRNRYVSECL